MRKSEENTHNQTQNTRKRAPARTPLAREDQLVNEAMAMAEEQLRNRTASPAVLVHFLRAGAEKTRLERVRLEADTKLALAKIESLESQRRSEEIAEEALRAFRSYIGDDEGDEGFYD